MRVPKWVSRVATAILLFGIASYLIVSAWIVHEKKVQGHIMHEGRIIADAIHEHDPLVHVYWTTDDHGDPNIVIRDPLARAKQDEIIEWAKAAKSQGRVRAHIVIDFQKEISHSSQPDVILREAEF